MIKVLRRGRKWICLERKPKIKRLFFFFLISSSLRSALEIEAHRSDQGVWEGSALEIQAHRGDQDAVGRGPLWKYRNTEVSKVGKGKD